MFICCSDYSASSIGAVMLQYVPWFKLYSTYLGNQQNAQLLIKHWKELSTTFKELLRNIQVPQNSVICYLARWKDHPVSWAYKAMVRPKLEYVPSVWDPHHKKWIQKLESMQNRAARICTNWWHNISSVTDMKRDLNWEPLYQCRVYSRVVFFYKIHHGLVRIPMPTYMSMSARHHCNHDQYYNILGAKKNCLKYSFFHWTAHDWNMLPAEVAHATSFNLS